MISVYFRDFIAGLFQVLVKKLDLNSIASDNSKKKTYRKKRIIKINPHSSKRYGEVKYVRGIKLKKAPTSTALTQMMVSQSSNLTRRRIN
jgi:hypothetical protein